MVQPWLGGRLPLVDPAELKGPQRNLYDKITAGVLFSAVPFQSKTADGRLIGPFNAGLFSPEIGSAFLSLQEVEAEHTGLSNRLRQVVILTVGSVWQAPYELYAHAALARKAGLSDETIRALVAGGAPADLNDEERAAQQFTRQLTAERRVDDAVYQTAASHFHEKHLVEIVMLAGCYQVVCSVLNAFAVPAPEPDYP